MKKVTIIAEAGVNHNGQIDLAKALVDKAVYAGADIIKFQTFLSKNLASKLAQKAEYQKKETGNSESQQDMLKKLELTFDEFIEIRDYCNLKNIEFLSTAFDFESIDFLHNIGMGKWKIPSGEITNLPYLLKIAKLNQPVILSTGMSNIDEVKEAVKVLRENGTKDITLLHCTTEYPTPFGDVNLKAMLTIAKELELPFGYSDHTKGTEVSIAATALGASIIEKHFTLDKNMEGPDHKASLEPNELESMIESIRNIEIAMGDGIKKPAASEIKNVEIVRKSIIAKHKIMEGEIFTEENLTVKRPGSGISPMQWFEIIGTKSKRNFEEDELIEI